MIKQETKRVLLMLMSIMMTCIAYAETIVTVDGIKYLLSGEYASVYRVASENTSEHITIPSTIMYNEMYYTVNTVSDYAFNAYYSENRNVVDIILPRTIETIGKYAFSDFMDKGYESKIQNVTCSKGVTTILDYAFRNLSIKSVKLENGLTTIGKGAFCLSMIKTLKIPTSVTSIGVSAFKNCKSLTSLVIPNKVTSIGENCFDGCDLLRELIYLSSNAPLNWTATSRTYVPSKAKYGNPKYKINNANVLEMVSFSEATFTYSGNVPKPTWTNNMEGYSVNLEMQTLKSDVGTYEEVIPAAFTKGEDSFTANISYKYTVKPVKLKAKVNNTSRTYGEANPNFTITYSGFVNGEDESVFTTKPVATTSADEKSAVGTYPITISGGEAKNYTFEYEQGELTVNKASLGIQVMDANKVYGTENPTFTLGYSGLKNNETILEWKTKPTFTTTATKASGAGSYDVTVTCEPKNYEIISNTPGKLTITKAPLTVKANNVSMDYCGTMPTYSYTYSGFVNGDTENALTTKPSMATEATATSNAGTYAITPEGAQSNNYDFTYTAGTLTIKQRPLMVKANSASRLYGEENPTFTVEYSGFVNNETKAVLDVEPTTITTANIQSKAGTYDIRVSGGQAKNYTLNYQNGQLTITPRPLKAFVGNYERPYGEDNPTFTIEYEGLVGNDTGYSLQTQPMVRTTATKTSNVGTYPIEVTGGYSPNYMLSYGSGQLTIVKAEQTFTWNQDLTNLKIGDQVELQASASSNLPITFTADSENFAEIYKAGSKTYMECKKAGSFHIKAVQEGNDNYYSTQRINKEVTIVGEEEYNPTLFIKQTDNGMVSTKVNKGSTHTFTIYAETGWKIHSVTFNDKDVTNELDSKNSFTTPVVNENSTLIIVYEQENSAVNAIEYSNLKVLATSEGIRVSGVNADDVIRVYNIDGVLKQSVRAESSQVEIPLHKDRVYVVKVGTKSMKLRL